MTFYFLFEISRNDIPLTYTLSTSARWRPPLRSERIPELAPLAKEIRCDVETICRGYAKVHYAARLIISAISRREHCGNCCRTYCVRMVVVYYADGIPGGIRSCVLITSTIKFSNYSTYRRSSVPVKRRSMTLQRPKLPCSYVASKAKIVYHPIIVIYSKNAYI